MNDPNLMSVVGVSDGELRLANHHLAAVIASMEHARHFVAGSPDFSQRILAVEMTVAGMRRDIEMIRNIASRVYPPADATVTRSPDGQHHEGRWSGPLHNAQNIPKNPETP